MRSATRPSHRSTRTLCEALENRRLLSLTVEIRNTDGSASATATSIGQVLNLEVLAVVSSADNQPSEDALQNLTGSFIATGFTPGSVAGNLAVANLNSFNAPGAAAGTQQDLNGDGNLDVGAIDPFSMSQDFVASSGMVPAAAGVVVGNTRVFQIAMLSYTVTGLNEGGQTSINFVPYVSFNPGAAAWAEGGVAMNNLSGNFVAGSAFTVSDPLLVAPPIIQTATFGVPVNTPTIIYELSNPELIDPLDPASVTIDSPPLHGTDVVQSDGTILYTPIPGYQGTDSFLFFVADIDGRVFPLPSKVNLNVNAVSAPKAADLSLLTSSNEPAPVDVLAQATPANLNPNEVMIVNPPAHGIASVQSDGSIEYFPNENYSGSDTFSYRFFDYQFYSSNVASVSVTVQQPVPPSAEDDSFNVDPGVASTLNVFANDTPGSLNLALLPQIISQPAHGTVSPQPYNTVVYTPAAGYSGHDSFTYAITDILGDPSNIATVSLTIGDIPPTANDFAAAGLAGQTDEINVLSHVTTNGGAAVAPAKTSVAMLTAPTDGTASINADGSIAYTPVTGFVGADSFTYAVADRAGGISSAGTISVDVGVEVSDAKGQIHLLSFTDAAGGVETISLNHGTAGVFFSGTASLSAIKNGKATLTGSGLNITHFALGNTTRASVLSIRGSINTPVTLGQISDNSPMGSINAASVNVTGDITLNSVAALTLGNISNSAITIGTGLPGKFSLTSGAVSGSSLTSLVPITAIKSVSWEDAGSITAPSINSLIIKTDGLASNISSGALGSLSVAGSLTGNITATSARSIRVTGDLNGSTISIAGNGNLGQLIAKSVANSSVLAARIQSLSLGTIATNNGGTRFGIKADSIGSFTGIFGTTPLHLGGAQLKSATVLQAFLNQKGIALGDFQIGIGT